MQPLLYNERQERETAANHGKGNYPDNLKWKHHTMKTYIFKVTHSSPVRGYNREVSVYRIKNNKPVFVGYNDRINTAAYKGDRAVANLIISKEDGHKMLNGYDLKSKEIQVFEI